MRRAGGRAGSMTARQRLRDAGTLARRAQPSRRAPRAPELRRASLPSIPGRPPAWGAFAVVGQIVMMRGSQPVTGLPKQNDGAQEGKRVGESISGAEHGLQAVPARSNKNSRPLAREQRGSYCSVAYGIKT